MTPVTYVADAAQDDSFFRERTRRLCIYLPSKRLDSIRLFMDVFTLLHNYLMSIRDWGEFHPR